MLSQCKCWICESLEVGCTIFYVDEDRCEAIYVISPFLALAALTLDVDEDGAIEPLFTKIK